MHFLVIFTLASMAAATGRRLLEERQDIYTAYDSGIRVPCAPQNLCGQDICLRQGQVCCPSGTYVCRTGDYCLGYGNACCHGAEDPVTCSNRYNIQLPPDYTRPGQSSAAPPPSSTPLTLPSNTKPTLTLPSTTKTPPAPPSTSSVPVITPSYPAGNATIPIPTATAVTTSSVQQYIGGSERVGMVSKWVLAILGAVGLII